MGKNPLSRFGKASKRSIPKKPLDESGNPEGGSSTNSDTDRQKKPRTLNKEKQKSQSAYKAPPRVPVMIIAGILATGVIVIAGDNLPLIGGTTGHQENRGNLNIIPENDVLKELFSETDKGKDAAKRALGYYRNNNAPALAIFSSQELDKLEGRIKEDDSNKLEVAHEVAVVTSGDAVESHAFLNMALADEKIRDARQFGNYSVDGIRPSAMAMSAWIGKLIKDQDKAEEMSRVDREAAQTEFKESKRFAALAEDIGNRVGLHWTPQEERSIQDGAAVGLILAPTGHIEEAIITRSTAQEDYDEAALKAAQAAAPYHEIMQLEPWLRPVMQETSLTFGKPPTTPMEMERLRLSGELRKVDDISDEELANIEEMLANGDESDLFASVRAKVESEWMKQDRSGYTPERDAEVTIHLSTPLGVILDVEVNKRSRDYAFDDAAIVAVDNAGPFRAMRQMISVEQDRMANIKLHFYEDGIR